MINSISYSKMKNRFNKSIRQIKILILKQFLIVENQVLNILIEKIVILKMQLNNSQL